MFACKDMLCLYIFHTRNAWHLSPHCSFIDKNSTEMSNVNIWTIESKRKTKQTLCIFFYYCNFVSIHDVACFLKIKDVKLMSFLCRGTSRIENKVIQDVIKDILKTFYETLYIFTEYQTNKISFRDVFKTSMT